MQPPSCAGLSNLRAGHSRKGALPFVKTGHIGVPVCRKVSGSGG